MHNALAIQEIQSIIFSHLILEKKFGLQTVTDDLQLDLIAVAVTSKAFVEMALDVKWRSVSNIAIEWVLGAHRPQVKWPGHEVKS